MEEVIIEDDDDQTTHKHEMPARNSTHGAGSSTNCALTTEPLSCPFCPFIVECYDQVSVMQEHVENVHHIHIIHKKPNLNNHIQNAHKI